MDSNCTREANAAFGADVLLMKWACLRSANGFYRQFFSKPNNQYIFPDQPLGEQGTADLAGHFYGRCVPRIHP